MKISVIVNIRNKWDSSSVLVGAGVIVAELLYNRVDSEYRDTETLGFTTRAFRFKSLLNCATRLWKVLIIKLLQYK